MSRRLFIQCRKTKFKYLIDTGSDISVFPHAWCKRKQPAIHYHLFAANGSPIQSYGFLTHTLDFGLKRNFEWNFIIADVTTPIIGADFLCHFDLLVDLKRCHLRDGITNLTTVACAIDCGEILTVKSVVGDSPFCKLLRNFPHLTRPDLINKAHKNHNTFHHIITSDGPPVSSKPRRLAPDKLKIAKDQFKQMLELGLTRPSSSPWSSPLHLVPKKNGDWRPCGDYRRLNARTIPDKYPIRFLDDFTANLHNKQIFSVIDLVRAFNQIPVAADSIQKTAIITPFGLFEFPHMTFGLRNAAQTFQRFIDECTRDLDFIFPYIDDLLVASSNEDEHLQHLNVLFKRLQDYGLVINVPKCQLGASEVIFLGYRINKHSIAPTDERVKDIINMQPPTNVKALRRFLGALNSYRKFLKNAATVLAPLNQLLEGSDVKSADSISRNKILNNAFNDAKQLLANATLLAFPKIDAEWAIFCDASNTGIGAVLQQIVNGSWQPLAFFSRKLQPNVQKLSTYDRELQAIYEAVKFFRHIFEGRHVVIYTDHKSLQDAFRQNNDLVSPWRFRRLDLIAQFTTDVRHISGENNTVADALSRVDAIRNIVRLEDFAAEQANDNELHHLLSSSNNSSLNFRKLHFDPQNVSLYCDVTTDAVRPYVPAKLRKHVFDALHGLAHPGVRGSQKLVASRFVWPGVNRDSRIWAKACIECQKNKVHRHVTSPIANIALPTQRFEHIHIDLVTLPVSRGHSILLTIIDRFTRFPEAIPLQDGNAENVARALITAWFARYGIPHRITSDRCGQCESARFKSLTNFFGIRHLRTTPYHPQSNGLVERLHRQLKAALLCHNESWFDALPAVLLGLRSAWKEDIKATPAELVYGEPLRLPGELLAPSNKALTHGQLLSSLKEFFNALSPSPTHFHGSRSTFLHKDLQDCSHVLIRDDRVKTSFSAPYEGPFPVIERKDKYFIINVKSRLTPISIDRLKPAYFLANDEDSGANNIDVINNNNINKQTSAKHVTFQL